jgi:hypothetical protein
VRTSNQSVLFFNLGVTTPDIIQKYPEDYQPEVVRERQKNVQAMEEYLTKIKEYSKDSRNSEYPLLNG